ncbi:sensor histidine kinase [Halolamina salifodinae]|uniref:histidine kinase n=1 Tax=Halolamina salifodinae TaxID=1202767 RepID=A0A8T4GTH5_9EURY|nr:sensor histidine kinase [Halolamina salifodinae]MBP1986179.1 signal transduction histidine kinase [Halolamina salifodinae]
MNLVPVGIALVAAGVVLCAVALLTGTRRDESVAVPFAVMASVTGVGAAALGGAVLTGQSAAALTAVAISVCLLFPVPWLVFSLRYIGQSESVSSTLVAVLALPVVCGLLATGAIFAAQSFPWFMLPSRQTASGPVAAVVILLTMVRWVAILYAGGVTIIASGLLLWTFHRYDYLDSTTGTLIGTFGTVPWISILLGFQMAGGGRLALPRIAVLGFLIGAVTAAGAVSHGGLFDRVPAAGNVGPRTLFDELEEVVVVTDDEGSVVTLNAAAESKVNAVTVGVDMERVLDASLDALHETSTVALRTEDGRRLFEPTLSPVTDQRDRRLGYAIVLRDVTGRTTRQQRLEVFNRVLRHNLRNDMNVVLGHAQRLRTEHSDDAVTESAETVLDTGRRLLQFAEKAQTAEQLMSGGEATTRELRLEVLVSTALGSIDESETVDRDHDIPGDIVIDAPPELLKRALSNLVENAVEHNDRERPWVRVRASYDADRAYPLHIAVADDGPTIPDHERKVIEARTETPLKHGSGMGLWVVRWAVTQLGGEIGFTERDPRGTSVVLRLPHTRCTDDEA